MTAFGTMSYKGKKIPTRIYDVYWNKEQSRYHPDEYIDTVMTPEWVISKKVIVDFFNHQFKGTHRPIKSEDVVVRHSIPIGKYKGDSYYCKILD